MKDTGKMQAQPTRILCPRCPLYNRAKRRCTIGKVNPRTKVDTYETARLLGVRALCPFNPYRERLLHPKGEMRR
jgi:hypothetical protein